MYRSAVLGNTPIPIWHDEEWIVRNIPHNAKLCVKIYDKDDEKLVDDYIGRFDVDDLIHYEATTKGHKIIGAFGQNTGRFHLTIQAMQSNEETRELPLYTFDGPCRYFRHDSHAIGRLTMLNADCVYSTWKIPIKRILFYFPQHERQYWNRQYKAAQTIFGDCAISLASQITIKLAHKTLYRRTLRHNENARLNNANDLWKLIFTDRVTQRIRPCVYTYVIICGDLVRQAIHFLLILPVSMHFWLMFRNMFAMQENFIFVQSMAGSGVTMSGN
jgi:hypothetical protein